MRDALKKLRDAGGEIDFEYIIFSFSYKSISSKLEVMLLQPSIGLEIKLRLRVPR
jgi:hypothetical protein